MLLKRAPLALALAAICVSAPWYAITHAQTQDTICADDFHPVPCYATCPNAGGFKCGTPAQAQNCFDTTDCDCTLNPFGTTPCGLQFSCATGMLNGKICKNVNNCTDRCR